MDSLNSWPQFSLDEIEDVEIEYTPARLMYQSLVFFLRLPEKVIYAFIHVLRS